MRWATFVVVIAQRSVATMMIVAVLAACNDLRDFRGTWQGPRVGDTPVLRVGASASTAATLSIEELDTSGLAGTLSIDGLVTDAQFISLPGAEADALAGMTFAGAPLRVYLSFISVPDGGGEALALVALFDDRRIEVRVLRGGSSPLYAIFALTEP